MDNINKDEVVALICRSRLETMEFVESNSELLIKQLLILMEQDMAPNVMNLLLSAVTAENTSLSRLSVTKHSLETIIRLAEGS